MSKTKIEWATDVWNPTVGCTKVSAGCKNCYAERMFERFHVFEKFTSGVHLFPERLDQPRHWKKPRRIFVDSMSDLFHDQVPVDFIIKVWLTMEKAAQHTFIILTKRPKRMQKFVTHTSWGIHPLPNVWLGISAEDQATADERISLLLKTPAAVHFVSVEPMLESIRIDDGYLYDYAWGRSKKAQTILGFIDWVICGCESGPGARPMDLDWARSLRDQCQAASVPFFLKQAQIDGKLVKMPELDGQIWAEYPKEEKR